MNKIPTTSSEPKKQTMITLSVTSVRTKAQNTNTTFEKVAEICASAEHAAKIERIWNLIQKKAGKKNIAEAKDALGWIIPTGFCATGHADETLENYTGIVCIDIDGNKETPEKAVESRRAFEMLERAIIEAQKKGHFQHVIAVGISPSRCGFKAFVQTDAECKQKHYAAAAAAMAWFKKEMENAGIKLPEDAQYDNCTKTLSQPHYLPASMTVFSATGCVHVKNVNESQNGTKKEGILRAYEPPSIQDISKADPKAVRAHKRLIAANAGASISGYSNYLRFLAAYIALFGKEIGPALAVELLSQSPAFQKSDFRKKIQTKIKSLNVLKTAGTWLLDYAEKFKQPAIQLPKGIYLADLLEKNNWLNAEFFANRAIVCPTGAGKTWAIIKLSQKTPVVFCAPTRALAAQAAKDAGGIVWYGGNKDKQTLADALANNFIATTYHSLPDLLMNGQGLVEKRLLIIDEAHNLAVSASEGYMLPVVEKLIACTDFFDNITTLTATPVSHWLNKKRYMDTIEFTTEQKRIKAAAIQVQNDATLTEVAAAIAQKAVKNEEQVIVYLNDKGRRLLKMQALLDEYGINFATLNADEKDSEDYAALVELGKLNAPVVVATSVIKEGVSVRGCNKIRYICVGGCGEVEVQQLCARARGAEHIALDVIYRKDNGNEKTFDNEAVLRKITSMTANAVRELNQITVCAADGQILSAVAPKNIKFNQETQRWEENNVVAYNIAYNQACAYYRGNIKALANATKEWADWVFEKWNENVLKTTNENVIQKIDEIGQHYAEGLQECITPKAVERLRRKGGGWALAARVVNTLAQQLSGAVEIGRKIALDLLADCRNAAKAKHLATQIMVWQAIWCSAETPLRNTMLYICEKWKGVHDLQKVCESIMAIAKSNLGLTMDEKQCKKLIKALFDVEYLHGGKRQTVRLTMASIKLGVYYSEIVAAADKRLLEEKDIFKWLNDWENNSSGLGAVG